MIVLSQVEMAGCGGAERGDCEKRCNFIWKKKRSGSGGGSRGKRRDCRAARVGKRHVIA